MMDTTEEKLTDYDRAVEVVKRWDGYARFAVPRPAWQQGVDDIGAMWRALCAERTAREEAEKRAARAELSTLNEYSQMAAEVETALRRWRPGTR
jgi:hypothetical protein